MLYLGSPAWRETGAGEAVGARVRTLAYEAARDHVATPLSRRLAQ
jgi:hypothetical protein